MYQCRLCGHVFENPKIVSDDEGDEQYDECPKCGGGDDTIFLINEYKNNDND